jgi:X-X-X-Leu-X-X-Gly heptad repeat protein
MKKLLALVCLLAVAMFVGCGGDKPKPVVKPDPAKLMNDMKAATEGAIDEAKKATGDVEKAVEKAKEELKEGAEKLKEGAEKLKEGAEKAKEELKEGAEKAKEAAK